MQRMLEIRIPNPKFKVLHFGFKNFWNFVRGIDVHIRIDTKV